MAQLIKGNYNALMWLQDELQQSLAHALTAINHYIDDAQEKSLSDCIEALYQVKGTLDMVNISGGAMLADEVQHTAIAVRNGKVGDRDKALDALVRSLLLLPNYLKLLSNDFQDHPLVLLESYNELREARELTPLNEADLFQPLLNVPLPDSISPSPDRPVPEIAIDKMKLGHAFQVMLLNWLRQHDLESLRKMRGVMRYLRLSCQQEKTTLLWWSADALLEALEQNGLDASADIKQLLGKLVLPIKTQAEQGESVLMQDLPTGLISQLLLAVAHATSHGHQVTLLKASFELNFFDQRPKVFGMSNNALSDAHLALLEQIEELKPQIDSYLPEQDPGSEQLGRIIQQLQNMTDTLAFLSEYEASNLLSHQADCLQVIIDDDLKPDEAALTELADTLLEVEGLIQSSTQANVNDQLRQTVISECLLEMANIKETLTLMSQAQRHPDELGETEQQLTLIAGSLEMLNYPQAADILRRTVEKVSEQNQSHEAFTPAQLNRLADVLACCDIYMEGIRQHGYAEDNYLTEASDKLVQFDLADDSQDSQPGEQDTSDTETSALAELDTLLTADAGPLLFEPDQAEDQDTLSDRQHESVIVTEQADNVDTTLPPPAQWQFAEGVDAEIAEVFIEEASEVMAELDSLLPAWQQDESGSALTDIRRHFHTLKGSGRMAGATVIGELAWAVEQVLNHVLDGTRPMSEQVRNLTEKAYQLIPSLLVRFTRGDNRNTAEVDSLHALKQQCLEADAPDHIAPEDHEAEAATDAGLTDFDPGAYAAESDADDTAHSAAVFNIDTQILTGVERYIQALDTHATGSPQALSEAQPETVSEDSLTGVEKYLRRQPGQTGVERYIAQHGETFTTVTDAPSVNEVKPLTSVDLYLIKQARQNRPETGVERYLAQQDAKVEADAIAAEEDAELLQIFASEAAQYISALRQGLDDIGLSRQVSKPLLRAVHSLKGCANIAGITAMGLIATELDAAMKALHARDISLDDERMALLGEITQGLQQILDSVVDKRPEPDVRELAAAVASLQPAAQDDDGYKRIDPEFLMVFLEETDELLDKYTRQLATWQTQPDDADNNQALAHTLYDLEQAAKQAEQQAIADIYAALARLIQQTSPHTAGLDALLEQGYEQLNQHVESLIQNKPPVADFDFADRVDRYLASQADNKVAESATDAEPVESFGDVFPIPADADPDLLEAFSEEAGELLTSSGQAIKGWRRDIFNQADPAQLQRDLHTLKGGARLTGIAPMADLTHQVENLVLAVRDNKLHADSHFFDLLLRCQDSLSEMQEKLAARQPIMTAQPLIDDIAELIAGHELELEDRPLNQPAEAPSTITTLTGEESRLPSHVEQIRVRADLLDYLTNFAGEVSISRDRVTQQHAAMRQQLREMEETVTRLHDQLRKLEIETETQILFRYEDERLRNDSDFDPLELDRFSMIQQLSRGLTESVTDLNDISRSMDTLVRETDAIMLQQSRINTDLQEGLMATRLLPFTGIVPRLERIVRQTASELGKQVEIAIHGDELELDRTILDRLVAPLEHMLRNAIAHGIEPSGERLANGKAERGQLSLELTREGSEIVIDIRDDGRGIDVDKVREKALAMQLIAPDERISDEELTQLILTSGFSTADNISQLAGRGVGMDVVSNEIRSLKGRLTIQSQRGQGTHFMIRLPLTLSVIQSLLVRVQDEQYAVPLGSVNAGERLSVANIRQLLGSDNAEYEFNGEKYDFMPLSALLDKPLNLPGNLKQQLPLLLFRSGNQRIALLVDDIISNREIVIKPVGRQLSTISALNGATILGDGQVVFILDIPTLIETSRNIEFRDDSALDLGRELNEWQDRLPRAMVVDDSITMRKASGNLLKRLGFDVVTARDGIDALSQLHEQQPDIILLDVEMPRMDGFEFASIVRNDDSFRHLPIIMITSRTGQKHRDRAVEIGVNAYLGKPYQEEELVKQMHHLLGRQNFPAPPTEAG
jgi:chemosensory pili system protein ChpA (sensor histidine kinase/response regulator)